MRYSFFLYRTMVKLIILACCFYSTASPIEKKGSNYSTTDLVTLNNYSPVKIYLHFDKSEYIAEETIWFKVYLLNNIANQLGKKSEVVYIDLIDADNTILDTKIMKTTSGFGEGNILLPFDINEGQYTIRAYTNFMRNFDDSYFYQKSIIVHSIHSNKTIIPSKTKAPTQISDLAIQFFPEGGQLVSGYNSKIGFKVVGRDDKGIDVKGEITDETGKKIVGFTTSKFGMGLFHFIPKDGKAYTAKIFHNNTTFSYSIPKPMNKGVALRIIEGKEFYQANIESSLMQGIDKYRFTANQRNGELFSSEIVGNSANAVIRIPKDIFTEGVINFELSNQNGQKVASRLSFYEDLIKEEPKVTVDFLENDSEQKVLLNLDSTADMITNVSVSITKIPVNSFATDQQGIKTYLLLSSEVTEAIEQPDYYINSTEAERKQNLDILMLTQKWKNHSVSNLTQNLTDVAFEYETGITLSGTIKSAYNKNIPAIAIVSLSYKNKDIIGFDETISDANGRFVFKNLDFSETTTVMLQALNPSSEKKSNNGSSDFHIEMDVFSPPTVTISDKYKPSPTFVTNSGTKKFNRVNDSLQEVGDDVIQLDAVEVQKRVIKKAETYYSDKRLLYKEASQTFDFDEYSDMGFQRPLEVLSGRVPGLSVRNRRIYLRAPSSLDTSERAGAALILVDGMPSSADVMDQFLSSDIDFIDIIKGPRAAIYGSRSANGVIAIYTKTGIVKNKLSDESIKNSSIKFKHQGFVISQDFHLNAVYNTKGNHFDNKGETTHLWKPTILLTKKNKKGVLFHKQLQSGKYKIILQGMTSDGSPLNVVDFIELD